MRRREFLAALGASTGAVVLAPALWTPAVARRSQDGGDTYGPLATEPDENGLLLPEGFSSRVIARSGQPVEGTDFTWPIFPDGAAVFAAAEGGGWIWAVNSEHPGPGEGGVSAIVFDADGQVVDAYSILQGTQMNCAGGPTPWGTWLSCEEHAEGQVWECDPSQAGTGEARPALGVFPHEAVAVDPDHEHLFLTEDVPNGRLYRFTPDAYPDLSAGLLEAAEVGDGGRVTWHEISDPSAANTATRDQAPDTTAFDGGEGIWFHDGSVFFTTKGDNHVRRFDTEAETIEILYDGSGELQGVDNITVEDPTGDLFVAEDGDNMEVVRLTPEGEAIPFLRIVAEGTPPGGLASEVTGPCFSPDGTRLYFGSQRGGPGNRGVSYEVTGPFAGVTAATTTTTVATGGSAAGDDDGGSDLALPLVGGAMALGVAAAGVGVWRVRARNRAPAQADSGAADDSG